MHGDFGTKIWISATETDAWADGELHGSGRWPCSTLRGKRLFCEFDRQGDLVDFTLNGRSDADCDGHEFNALASDFLRHKFGPDHPAIR